MITVVQAFDPLIPSNMTLNISTSLRIYYEMAEVVTDELEKAVRAQVIKELEENPEVKESVRKAATVKLLEMLRGNGEK